MPGTARVLSAFKPMTRRLVFDCPERQVTVLTGIVCHDNATHVLETRPMNIECPVCAGVHCLMMRAYPKRKTATQLEHKSA